MFTLVVEDRYGNPIKEFSLEAGERILGRHRSCDVVLPEENVSRRHARLLVEGGTLFIEDLQSVNGVYVNGERISARMALREGSVVRIGDFTIRVIGERDLQERRSSPKPLARLVGRNLAFAEQVFEITGGPLIVGRGKDATISIPDPSVSRLHARISRQPDGRFLVEDLASGNGTFVNDRRVKAWQLKPGDLIRFGNVEFVFEAEDAEGSEAAIAPSSNVSRKIVRFGVPIAFAAICGLLVILFWPKHEEPTLVSAPPEAVKEVAPRPTLDPMKEALELFSRRDLEGAEKIVQKVLRERPGDAEAVKLSNRILVEKRALQAIRSAEKSEDPVSAAGLLLEVPQDSIFIHETRVLLKSLLPALETQKNKMCRAKKIAECARLKGITKKVEAAIAGQ